jgi:hypothetical protein
MRRRTPVVPFAGPAGVFLLGGFLALLGGCLRVTHRPLPPGDLTEDVTARGIRYYGTSLYLLLHSDGEGGVVTRLLELPDVTRKTSLEVEGVFGSVDLQLRLRDGALTESDERLRNDVLALTLMEAAGSIAQSAASGMYRGDPASMREHQLPPPSLYKIVARGSHLELLGGQGDAPIRVPLPRSKRP